MELSRVALLPVVERSQIGDARRRAATMAGALGFSAKKISDISIIASELASNLVKHTSGGALLVQSLRDSIGTAVIEIISMNKRPGMNNPEWCLKDGHTTSGSLGIGLGAVQRLSDQFDLYATRDSGTIIWSRSIEARANRLILGGLDCICVPKDDETVSGDDWSLKEKSDTIRFIMVDGLGHGPEAADAARTAIDIFDNSDSELDQLMQQLHAGLRNTRGAVIVMAEIGLSRPSVSFCGIGNITTVVESATGRQHLMSQPGIVGYEINRFATAQYPWADNSIFIMHTDGCNSQWSFDEYPGIRYKHAGILSSALFRDYRRSYDDCSILVYKAQA